jgi:hypothetical protein
MEGSEHLTTCTLRAWNAGMNNSPRTTRARSSSCYAVVAGLWMPSIGPCRLWRKLVEPLLPFMASLGRIIEVL